MFRMLTASRLARLVVSVPFAALVVAACKNSTTSPPVLSTITVTPSPTLAINATQQFSAVGYDAAGAVVSISPTWSVAAGGGTMSTSGLFTAGTTLGTFTNTAKATSGSISGTATVIVIAGALATITITPNAANLPPNAPQQFTAVGKDAGGNVVPISPAPTWSVVAGGGAISTTGLFTAGATTGTFPNTVKATSGSISGTTTVTVATGSGTGTGTGKGPAPVVLGTAGNYVILAKSAISNVPTSSITGDLGLSPAAASFITGFSLVRDVSGQWSTSAQVSGSLFAADYTAPTPANMTTAIGDMQTAYVDAAGRTNPDYTELAAGNLGGLTLPPGLYKFSNTVTIPTDVTLSGGANDTWIFQIAGGLTQSSATHVILTGGAVAQNVFWQVAGIVTVGTTADMEGEVLSLTQIIMQTGATANGRLLAQTQVTLDGNTVVKH